MNYAYRQDLDWLVSDFATRVADIAHAAVVSADGVPLALSDQIPEMFAEQLAAITSGLASLMQGAARIFEAGSPTQALVEMEFGLLLLKQISDGSCLCVLASTDCDTDLVSYEMSLLVEAAGEVLSPALRGSHNGLVSRRQFSRTVPGFCVMEDCLSPRGTMIAWHDLSLGSRFRGGGGGLGKISCGSRSERRRKSPRPPCSVQRRNSRPVATLRCRCCLCRLSATTG